MAANMADLAVALSKIAPWRIRSLIIFKSSISAAAPMVEIPFIGAGGAFLSAPDVNKNATIKVCLCFMAACMQSILLHTMPEHLYLRFCLKESSAPQAFSFVVYWLLLEGKISHEHHLSHF